MEVVEWVEGKEKILTDTMNTVNHDTDNWTELV